MAINSLKKLMSSTSPVQDAVSDYIEMNLVSTLVNIIGCTKKTLVAEVLELLIQLQEYFGPDKSILKKSDAKKVSQSMGDSSKKNRRLSATLVFRTSKTPLLDFLVVMSSQEVS